jgi:hypothetical protein
MQPHSALSSQLIKISAQFARGKVLTWHHPESITKICAFFLSGHLESDQIIQPFI